MATTTNFGWETPDDTDLVKDGAAAMRTLGNSIDTSFVDLKGGTTGQILSKASNTDLDYTWVSPNPGDITGVTAGTGISGGGTSGDVTITNSMATAIDAKGDLIAGTGADAFARLAVGTNNQVLMADSSTATGLKWATAGGGGKILQVVSVSTGTSTQLTTTSMADLTNVTASITPSATTSKIFILANVPVGFYRSSTQMAVNMSLVRGSTEIYRPQNGYSGYSVEVATSGTYAQGGFVVPFLYMDSPSTTSSTTYKIQAAMTTTVNSATAYTGGGVVGSTITLFEVGV